MRHEPAGRTCRLLRRLARSIPVPRLRVRLDCRAPGTVEARPEPTSPLRPRPVTVAGGGASGRDRVDVVTRAWARSPRRRLAHRHRRPELLAETGALHELPGSRLREQLVAVDDHLAA